MNETKQTSVKNQSSLTDSYFPWLSIIFSIFCIYILASQLELDLPFNSSIKELLFHPTHLKGLLASLILVYLLELLIFNRIQQNTQLHFQRLNKQIEKTWEQKNKQQQRANTQSDHSNKLKSFINDKLIEYMDFDEKFIHFKGIASEVRHNGVISYDKINIALNKAIEQQRFLALYEKENEEIAGYNYNDNTENALYDYQSAKDAIAYLWDLLDLSTAENMSLYIGNKLIQYEESYFQTQLNSNQHTDTSLTIGYHPTFHPLQALLMSLQLFTEADQIKYLLSNGKINSSLFNDIFHYENEQFIISSNTSEELLGNPNHIVLLLENLIKNAQFFSHKVRFKQRSDRIIVNINSHKDKIMQKPVDDSDQTEEGIRFSIYNRGNNIAEEEFEQIFKLGYTTRRKKDAHGRGLGLYFVKEIVSGYQGTINAVNILNKNVHYKLSLGLASGENFIYYIHCKNMNQRMVSYQTGSDNIPVHFDNKTNTEDNQVAYHNEIKIEHDIPIENIQVMNIKNEQLFSLNNLDSSEKNISFWVDNVSQFPRWEISLSGYKKKQIFTFKALDITGVQFDINIPSVIE